MLFLLNAVERLKLKNGLEIFKIMCYTIVSSVQALIKDYEPIVIEIEELMQKLDELSPLDETPFKS